MATEMAPKNVRNMADKPEGAHKTCIAKEGSDGRMARKQLTAGSRCPNYRRGGPGGACHGEKGLCAGKGLAESSLDSNKPQGCGEGRVDETKNPKRQAMQSENPTTLNSIQEPEERVKDTRSLVKECPETRCGKGIEWEKERTAAGENVAKDWTFETRKVENNGKNIDWSKDGGDKF
ncbi:hypothetical protein NDU88_002604 [Pleurodeles waltl]|uniref:Uncharacterized protein n=1 Tax=Pleurodeles waltl TaxID=8319 RepID=A0AAV7LE84_PLEWA|nr:hypothetical protein NDU88_002604 [Pleurodeles waltl]